MAFKEKPKSPERRALIDFVVPLQLEEIISRIEHIPEDAENAPIKFTVWYPEWDEADTNAERYQGEFQITLSENGSPVGTANGKMERWEGISTRFTGRFESEEGINTGVLKTWVIFWLPISILFVCPCIFLALTDTENSLGILAMAIGGGAAVNFLSLEIMGRASRRARLTRLTNHLKALVMTSQGMF
ncbi:MAG TPA: hypothetical protein VHL11_21185 [Phototrophicaceae bacterium]|jgi:hypothetical protein|nr:hypothetical protein [Phototrophicaceae bacterium]